MIPEPSYRLTITTTKTDDQSRRGVSMPAIGPKLPSERRRRRSRSDSFSSRSSYDFPTSRSSSSSRRRSGSPSGSDASNGLGPSVAGPHLPAGFRQSRSRSNSRSSCHSKASSSEDEGRWVGPVLPTASSSQDDGLSAGARAFLEREVRKNAAAKEAKLAAEKAANSRPEWMLLPPSLSNASSLQAVAGDPLNLKSRGFAQSTPRVSGRDGGRAEDADTSLWTETPEERVKRMQDQVSGVRSKDGTSLGEKERLEREMTARREAIREASIAASVAEERGKKSLVEEHNERRKKEIQEARQKRSREKGKRREEQEDHNPPRSSGHSRDSPRHRSSSRHRSHRHSDASEDDHVRRRERRERREGRERRKSESDHRRDKDKRKDKDSNKDKERKKSRKQREEEEVREGKAAAPLIWDREAALSIGGKLMDEKKRGKMIADANALGDRFGSGSRRFL
ncbi:uncharacterized protein UBRO2_04436 [Ustilago bromivora]|uniref:DUF3752 domain-containing protein n=1 Tax=Ustilago bromivora TaxID=307758 RepID=A0A8H8TU32_9BASI|nr:uncharacterized protein UBRO2_04436 [Ustilago bromivora]